MNRAIIFGRLGQDPELRMTQGGRAVMRLNVATNERVKKQGEWGDHTEWHQVIVWGKRAESLQKVLTKGSQVLIEGPTRHRKYEDRDGNTRYSHEIIADDVTLGARAGASGSNGGNNNNGGRDSYEGSRDEAGDDDIPF